jgi:hypothetical protein
MNLLETRLSEAAGHHQWACKDVKQHIIVCKESGFRACDRFKHRQGVSTPLDEAIFVLLNKNIFWLVIRHVALTIEKTLLWHKAVTLIIALSN